jgi:hypothetical protein
LPGKYDNNSGISILIPHLQKAEIIIKDLSTEIASLGVCYEMTRKDWGYQPEKNNR